MNWFGIMSMLPYAIFLIIADFIFLSVYKRRSKYLLRLLIPLALTTGVVFAMQGVPYNGGAFINFVRFFAINAALFVGFIFCYDTSPSNVLFSCTAGMALEQFASCTMSLVNIGFSFTSDIRDFFWARMLDRIVVFYPIYAAFGVVFYITQKRNKNHESSSLKMKIMSAAIVFICIGIYRFTIGEMTTSWIVARSLYSMTCCAFALIIQFGFQKEIRLQRDLDIANELYRQEIKHYDKWRDSLELINIKYHDLKHRISAAKTNKDDKEWEDIESALAGYENMLKTGNDVLDNIISEKRILCDSLNVKMTCMADGGALDGMIDADIFALFGNALDNAMNAARQVEDESKRNVSLIVRRVGEAAAVHVENYYVGELDFEGGLPKTANDKNFHGFGMKSIKMIVDKYNGTMNLSVDNNIFVLNIMLFPKSM